MVIRGLDSFKGLIVVILIVLFSVFLIIFGVGDFIILMVFKKLEGKLFKLILLWLLLEVEWLFSFMWFCEILWMVIDLFMLKFLLIDIFVIFCNVLVMLLFGSLFIFFVIMVLIICELKCLSFVDLVILLVMFFILMILIVLDVFDFGVFWVKEGKVVFIVLVDKMVRVSLDNLLFILFF